MGLIDQLAFSSRNLLIIYQHHRCKIRKSVDRHGRDGREERDVDLRYILSSPNVARFGKVILLGVPYSSWFFPIPYILYLTLLRLRVRYLP